MLIRLPRADDAEALTDLHLDVWDEAYADLVPAPVLAERRAHRADRVERWRAILADRGDDTLLAEESGRLVGFVSRGPSRDEPAPGLPTLEVYALYVRAEVYGTGVGHRLLRAAVGEEAAYLWVLEGNTRAVAFYERQGFLLDGAVEDHPEGLHRRMVRSGTS